MSILEREIKHGRPSDAILPIPEYFHVPSKGSGKRKEPLVGRLLIMDFRRATAVLRAGLAKFYEMEDPELPIAQIAAAPPQRYFNGLLKLSSAIYEKTLKNSSHGDVLNPYYGILLERTRAVFGAVLDARSLPDREEQSRRLWASEDERGRIMKLVLTKGERTIGRDICIGYGYRDRGKTEALAWGLSYPLEIHLAAFGNDDQNKPRAPFLQTLLNTDLGRMAA